MERHIAAHVVRLRTERRNIQASGEWRKDVRRCRAWSKIEWSSASEGP